MNPSIFSDEMLVASKYQSHLPALLACIGSTVGDVLEVGVGHFSTPQLHALCGAMGRRLVSIENDAEWWDFFYSKYGGRYESHAIILGNHRELVESFPSHQWAVSFIDHSPGGANRANAFRALIGCSQFVVVHDYWEDNQIAIDPLLDGLNHYVTETYLPPTLVASRFRAIPEAILNQ